MATDNPHVEALDYQALQEHTKRLLEAARLELARLDRERADLAERIRQMEVMLGLRTFANKKPRRDRISSESLKADIIDVLQEAPGQHLSAAAILEKLVGERAYPRTRSLRTRVYGVLSQWAREEDFLERIERGVYKLT